MHKRCSSFALRVAVLLAVSGTIGAAQSSSPEGPQTGAAPVTIAGKVTDSQGGPVQGAKVTLYQMIYAEGASSPNAQTIDEKSTGVDGAFTLVIPQGVDPKKTSFIVARKDGLSLGWTPWRTQVKQPVAITLREAKDLSGEVVDEKGQPVAEAEVRIAAVMIGKPEDRRSLAPPSFLWFKTDSNGRFLFARMPADATFEFTIEKPGRATLDTLDRMTYRGGRYQFSSGQADIKLTLPLEARIEGAVVERDSGKPAGGVMVTALLDVRLSMLLSPKTATTAPDGTFHFGALTAGAYVVQLSTSRDRIGVLRAGASVVPLPTTPEPMAEWVAQPLRVTVKAGETKSDLKLQLTKGGIIEVLVKDAAGRPVNGATANLFRVQDAQSLGGRSLNGRTDENGLARIRVAPGRYVFAGAFKEGFARRTGVLNASDAIAVEEGETKRIEHVLASGPKVAGIVRDEAGRPLAGVKFDVLPMMATPIEIMSDASGKFEVAWDPGMWGPQGTTFVLVARDVAHNLAEAVDLDEQGGTLDVQLKPGVVVTGTVLDQEGRPLPGARAQVMLQGSRWGAPLGRGDSTRAGPDGKFEIKALPPDREFTVSATADGYGRGDVRINPGDIKDNRIDAGQLKLTRADLSISGVVVDPNDKPVAGANVDGRGVGQPDSREVQTDAEGKFTLKGVCPGRVQLDVTSFGPARLHGFALAEGGATDLRIVISSGLISQSDMPRTSTRLKGRPLPPLKDLGIDPPAEAEGKMLLVCFWDMGQRPSRNCLTQLAAQAAQLSEKGVLVVAVHAAQVEGDTLGQWVQKNKIPFKTGAMVGDINKIKVIWGAVSLPYLILTDKKRTVVAEGFSPDDLDKQIEIAAAP